jgi:hypothetical protein
MTRIAQGWTKKKKDPHWGGEAHELLEELSTYRKSEQALAKIGQGLGIKLRELAPALRRYSINMTFSRSSDVRLICIAIPRNTL